MPKDISQYKLQDKDIFNQSKETKSTERKKRKLRPMETKLTCPIKVYFREDDYKILWEMSSDDGLDVTSFIRSIVKKEIKLRKSSV